MSTIVFGVTFDAVDAKAAATALRPGCGRLCHPVLVSVDIKSITLS